MKESQPPLANMEYLKKHGYSDFRKLDSGGQGTVYAVKKNGKQLAVKVMKVEFPREQKMGQDIQRELSIMVKLRHPSIIRVEEVKRTATKVYIFMEFAPNGTVGSVVYKKGPICEWNAKVWFCPVARALRYLHVNGVAHRDLKLDNILLDAHLNPKLTDFGFSTFAAKGKASGTLCGTPFYYPPEILKRSPYDPLKADVWCLGICLFIMLNQQYPFDEEDKVLLKEKQEKKDFNWNSKVKSELTREVVDLLSKLLEADPKKRIEIHQVCVHDWFPIDSKDIK